MVVNPIASNDYVRSGSVVGCDSWRWSHAWLLVCSSLVAISLPWSQAATTTLLRVATTTTIVACDDYSNAITTLVGHDWRQLDTKGQWVVEWKRAQPHTTIIMGLSGNTCAKPQVGTTTQLSMVVHNYMWARRHGAKMMKSFVNRLKIATPSRSMCKQTFGASLVRLAHMGAMR